MLKQIIVPLDGSAFAECVLPHAVAMARAFDAQVSLLQVIDQPTTMDAISSIDPVSWRLKKTEIELYLNTIKSRLENQGVKVEKDLIEGRVLDQIVKFAQTHAADLMILSSHGQPEHGFGSWNLSLTVQQLLQQRLTSALIVRSDRSHSEGEGFKYRRLLVPLDGSRRAEAALPIATRLAEEHQAELLLTHIVNRPDTPRRMPLSHEDIDLVNHLVERNREEASEYLEQLQVRLPGNVRTLLAVSDNVAAALQDMAEREESDLMVMTAHGYSGQARWPYGSITNRFIADGVLPLLVVQDQPSDAFAMAQVEFSTRQPGR